MGAERVVVVGGGLAGLSAACELLERGCNVTLLEKENNLGGNSSKATTGIAAPGTSLQANAGVKDDGADLAQLDGPEGASLIKFGPADIEWLAKILGVDNELVLRLTPGHKVARTIGTKSHFPGAVLTYAAIHVLQQVASVKPDRLSIISLAEATKLLHTQGKVNGIAYEADGVLKTIMGHVVLATGGYSGDLGPNSILATCAPKFMNYPTTNDERTSGDGIKLGRQVDADSNNLGCVQLTPTAAVIRGQEDSSFKIVISDAISGAGAKLIDGKGRRFCEEMSSAQDRVEAMSKAKGPFRLVIDAQQAETVQWLTDFYTQRKIMQKYKNISELQRELSLEVDAPTLDPKIAVNKPLFVAVVTPALYTCAGGLNTGWKDDSAGKVFNTRGSPIEGLYAAGEATSATFPKLWSVSGIPLLHAVHSGRMAGRSAAVKLGQNGGVAQDLRDLIISSITAPQNVATAAEVVSTPVETTEKSLDKLSKEELVAKVKQLLEKGPPAVASEGPSGIPMDEVKKHNTKEDAWMVINGNVIDVTKWIPLHPGGEQAVVAYLGQDASDEWNMIHKPGTVEKNLVQPGGNGPVLMGMLGGGGGGGNAVAASGDGGLTMADVGKHSTESDLWVVVSGKAYDVTKWAQVHPGGVQAITAYAGKDATDEWVMIHKPGTIEKNLAPANPNGPVDMGPVSGTTVAPAAAAPVDDDAPPPDGNGGIPGIIGAIVFLAFNLVLMVLRTVFFTGNMKFNVDNNRKGTIRSACFLLTFTIIHVMGNFVGMIKGPLEANGEGYFFDRLEWTGGFGIWKGGPFGLSAVELYLALALLLHVSVALKRSWDISINYVIGSGRWNMLLSGLTILFFLTMHLADIRFSSKMTYTELRPPKYYVAWPGVLEGRVFYETDESIPKVRVRDLYTREVELFKDVGTSMLYTVCICVFWAHMLIGWKKLVPADVMQIPKDHVKMVTYLGYAAATAIVSMYLSVVWYTYFAPAQLVEPVP